MILATDGLRTWEDINHEDGMNVLRGDISVRFHSNIAVVEQALPKNALAEPALSYEFLWEQLEDLLDN